MRIYIIARALNEERHITRFLRGYEWADKIMISDGGSSDNTVRIARRHPKVEVRKFRRRVKCPENHTLWMNPESAHFNHLINWLHEDELPDWVVYDDVDCVPTETLRKLARDVFGMQTDRVHQLLAYRLYLWGRSHYFPQLNEVGQSLWAWRPDKMDLRGDETDPFQIAFLNYDETPEHKYFLNAPLCLLHDGWPDEHAVQEKMRRYAAWGKPQLYPLESCGPLESLPNWAHE